MGGDLCLIQFCFANLYSFEIDNATLCYFTLYLAQFIFCRIIFRSRDCFCPSGNCCLSDKSLSTLVNDSSFDQFDSSKQKQKQEQQKQNGLFYREEVEMVMGKLGIMSWNPETETEAYVISDDLFEEKEPSLEEIKEAFDVFDEKKDGFIDAEELQRVVCSLGFVNGSGLGNCMRMIRVWDINGDGMIDLNEFIRLMEGAFR